MAGWAVLGISYGAKIRRVETMKCNANNEYAIPDRLDLFEDQNSQEHLSDDPSDLVLVLMAKGPPARDARQKSKS